MTGENTCRYGCESYSYTCEKNIGKVGGTLCNNKGGIIDHLGNCIVYDTCSGTRNCSSCYYGHNTCQGGYNTCWHY